MMIRAKMWKMWKPLAGALVMVIALVMLGEATGWCHGESGHEDPACCVVSCPAHHGAVLHGVEPFTKIQENGPCVTLEELRYSFHPITDIFQPPRR